MNFIFWWSLVTLAVMAGYSALILVFRNFWKKIPAQEAAPDLKEDVFVSIILIGRNEAANIPKCLRSIESNLYPKHLFEIIYVDDHSEDNSLEVLFSLSIRNLKVIRLQDHPDPSYRQSFKKMGIHAAVKTATGSLILQTDADAVVSDRWIISHVHLFQMNQAKFIAAPVFIEEADNWLEAFQSLDFMVNMGLTGAGIQSGWHHMANGANMSYTPHAFIESELQNSMHLASGDDMFLIQSVARKNPEKVFFLKSRSCFVTTKPEKTLKAFFRQRIRWATKTKSYREYGVLTISVLVFLTNILLLSNLIAGIFIPSYRWLFILFFILKMTADYSFVRSVSGFYGLSIKLPFFLISSLFYPFYFLITGMLALTTRQFIWKGRKVH